MTETIDRADDLVDEASITEGRAIVRFTRTEAALADLRAKYQGVVYDLTTTRGDTLARQARKELVSLRTGLDKRRKELKAPAIEFSRKIDSEAARITDEIVALEQPIDLQIKADEQRREEERLARLRAEEARLDSHRQRISDITNVAVRAAGMSLPSAEIGEKLALVSRITIGDDYEEFAAAAINAKAETILRLQELLASTQRAEEAAAENERNRVRLAQLEAADLERRQREAREADALRAEEQKAAGQRQRQSDAARALSDEIRTVQRRAVTASATGMLELVTLIENISIGDELGDFSGLAQKAKDDALADLHEMHGQKMQAELALKRQQEELEAARRESERLAALAEQQRAQIAELDKSLADPVADVIPEGLDSQLVLKAEAETPDATDRDAPADASPVSGPMGAGQPAAGGPADEPATVNLGAIAKRLGFALQQHFVEGALGIPHACQDKRAVLWRESQWLEIKAALVRHIQAL